MTMTATFTTMAARRATRLLLLATVCAGIIGAGRAAAAQDSTAQVQDVVAAAQNAAASGQPSSATPDDPTINGFAVEDAVKPGAAVHFKIETDARAFSIAIYRFWNGEAADELIGALPVPAAPQLQPPCVKDAATGALDCSNWSPSASWTVPEYSDAGTYYALLRRADTGGVNHILFVVSAP